jgi:hypothetical protein
VGRHPASFEKRRKEMERIENQKEKAKKKAERKESNKNRPDGGDPDIDWIVPGPQPSSSEPEDGSPSSES